MSLPFILVVDDQYARDSSEWDLFTQRVNLVDVSSTPDSHLNILDTAAVATVQICSGQRRYDDRVENDYTLIHDAVKAGLAKEHTWALVLLDVRFDSGEIEDGKNPIGQEGDDIFGEVVRKRLMVDFPGLPVVMLSSKRQEELTDQRVPYLSKQGINERMLKITLLLHGVLSPEQTKKLLGLDDEIVIRSPSTLAVFREAYIHAAENVSILIFGESGVGKEVLAKYIHHCSDRSGPFIGVNIAAFPKELLESELFGVEKGAATGVDERPGKFEIANKGTLFLDEIGDMPLDAQTKLLRAIQEREIYRIGGYKPTALDIRLICATSCSLPEMITAGSFRQDLYYRINTIPLTIPPLRQRIDEVIPLANVFLKKVMATSGKTGIILSPKALKVLERYFFPGNVRELLNLIQRLVSGAGNNQIISEEAVIDTFNQSNIHPEKPDDTSSFPPILSHSETNSLSEQYQDKIDRGLENEAKRVMPVTLQNLPNLLTDLRIDKNDPSMVGAKQKIEEAFNFLLKRLAGAALERCRDPVTGKINRQKSMQLLAGDPLLKGKEPARIINEILGRRKDDPLTESELEDLINLWKGGRVCTE